MNSTDFLRPRLTGARFNDHTIPLELLRDIAVLKDMIVEVAKWKFLDAHRERQRVPKGFSEGVELRLGRIEKGSVVPVIGLHSTSNTLFVPFEAYFEDARTAIIEAISAAQRNEDAKKFLPERALSFFQYFGRSLREDEAIELSDDSKQLSCRLNRQIRRSLLLASTHEREITEEIAACGVVGEIDDEKMRFHLRMPDGRRIPSQLSEVHRDTVVLALARRREGAKVKLEGIGVFDRSQRLLRIDTIENVDLLDPLDVGARIDELRSLDPGWLNGEGAAPSRAHLDWFVAAFEQYYDADLPLPYVYPTVDGGLQLEWTIGTREFSLELAREVHQGQWDLVDTQSGVEDERELNLDDEADWKWIASTIRDATRA